MEFKTNIYFFLYFIVIFLIGIFANRHGKSRGFLLANRNLGVIAMVSTIVATMVGSNALVSFSSLVYEYGFSAFWGFAGLAVGCLLLIPLSKRVKEIADEKNYLTMPQYFSRKYSRGTGLLMALAIFARFYTVLIIQYIAGGIMMSFATGLSYQAAVVVVGGIIFIYVFLGGFNAVVKTDMFQYFIMLILMIIIAFTMAGRGDVRPEQFNILSGGPVQSIVFFLFGLLTTLIAIELWQRIYAGRNMKVVRKSLVVSSICISLVGVTIVMIALTAKVNFPGINPEEALVYGMSKLLSPLLYSLSIVVIVSIIMSTVDSLIYVLALTVSRDIVGYSREFTEDQLVVITRKATVWICLLSIVPAVLVKDIIAVALSLGRITFAIVPAFLAGICFQLDNRSIKVSIIGGVLSVVLFAFMREAGLVTVIVPLIISSFLLLISEFWGHNT